ncbi:MAG TPA: group I intron-associated PD-(D/E)XK endonuclease [Terriglobales bacterium]|nr:group I intron-associated PD-(D/E)XK endonuclease [Terriglobales bacterium]
MPVRRRPKAQGELAELVFMCKAASLGLVVAKPWGDNLPYDFLVGVTPPFYRVQVKSTSVRHCRGYHLSCFRPASRQTYTARQIDFIAAYVIPERVWYVLPVRALRHRKTIVLFPRRPPSRGRGRFEKYREAWRLLRNPRQRA